MNPEFLDMTGGDTHRAQAIQRLLTELTDSPDPVLREMASGVLNGDLELRDAAASQVYSDAIADRFTTFWQHYQQLSPDEHEALRTEGHRYIEGPDEPSPGVSVDQPDGPGPHGRTSGG